MAGFFWPYPDPAQKRAEREERICRHQKALRDHQYARWTEQRDAWVAAGKDVADFKPFKLKLEGPPASGYAS